MSKNTQRFVGVVSETLPSAFFKVRLRGASEDIMAHLSGKIRLHRIRILPGDTVEVELSEYDKSKGRITRRL